MLSETWLSPRISTHFYNYEEWREDRADGKGGIALFGKEDMEIGKVEMDIGFRQGNSQIQVFKIEKIGLYIVNCYIPPSFSLEEVEWRNIIQAIPNPKLILGDMNGNHPFWGSSRQNHNGKIIWDSLECLNLEVLNDGSVTRMSMPRQGKSAVDLSMCSQEISNRFSWEILEDCGNSDHFPIIIEYNCNGSINTSKTISKRNFKKVNWEKYHDKILIITSQYCTLSYSDMMNIINQVAEEEIPRIKVKGRKPGMIPWWDEECQSAIVQRRLQIKNYKLNVSLENYLRTKQVIAQTRRLLREKKKKSFRNFCGTLDRYSSLQRVWSKIRKFSNHKETAKKGNRPSKKISEQILRNLSICQIDPDFRTCNSQLRSTEFVTQELEYALRERKDSASGMDEVSYSMIKNLPRNLKRILLNCYNDILKNGIIPKEWQSIQIYPILKPGKGKNRADSYRPIALTSCIAKIMERMIKNKLEWQLENAGKMAPTQYGFRLGRGCMDCLTFLTSHILHAFSINQTSLAVFLDISSAYDKVSISKLCRKLMHLEVPEDIINLIYNMLVSKKIFVVDRNNEVVGPGHASVGLNQGSPLSPLLFNIYTRDLYNKFPKQISIIQYADDLLLITSGKNPESMINLMNKGLDTLKDWLQNNNMELSIEKSKAMFFRPGKGKREMNTVRYNNIIIPWVSEIRYLGVNIQQNLKWNRHIAQIQAKANKGIAVMRAVTRVWWGADPMTLMHIYKGLVRSHLEYADIIFKPSARAILNKLDSVQYEALRIITGCMKSTPTNALQAECSEMSLEMRRKWQAQKYILKNRSTSENPIINLVQELDQIIGHGSSKFWRRKEVPYTVEAYRELRIANKLMVSQQKFPCFVYDFMTQISEIPVVDLNMNKENFGNKEFLEKASEKFKHYFWIFTDASKDIKTSTVGFGVFCPSTDFSFAQRLPNEMQICTAEIIAINKAITYCMEQEIRMAVIFTDSKSAIMKLNRIGVSPITDHISFMTKQFLIEANQNNCDIKVAWIPGHSGIKGNERADQLANIGRILNVPLDIELDKGDYLPEVKKRVHERWMEIWKKSIEVKGKWYGFVQSDFPRVPWYKNLTYKNRRHITTVIRMRTGHCLTMEHLHKLGQVNNPICQCNTGVGDLEHILFNCPIMGGDLYREIVGKDKGGPISVQSMLANLNDNIIKMIISYLDLNLLHL